MIVGNVIHLLGIDLVSGTPVIDIKPYIPQYDAPWSLETSLSVNEKQREQLQCDTEDLSATVAEALPSEKVKKRGSLDDSEAEDLSSAVTSHHISDTSGNVVQPKVSVAKWITDSVQSSLSVIFTARAEQQLKQFDSLSSDPNFQLHHLSGASELRSALSAVLQADPRSVYRRKHCNDQLYYLTVDIAHVTCWFDADTVEVLKVQSVLMMQKENESV